MQIDIMVIILTSSAMNEYSFIDYLIKHLVSLYHFLLQIKYIVGDFRQKMTYQEITIVAWIN